MWSFLELLELINPLLPECEKMPQSHSDTILERLHDQYLRGLDCDVIITAVDHLKTDVSESTNASSNQDVVWKSLSCHKNVLRAASSFFDRVFSTKFTYEKLEVDKGVEGMLVRTENDDRTSLQIILHKLSSHSVQALVNFAYTGFISLETNILRRAVEDFKIMNVASVIKKLESRLEELLSLNNCIPNLIISYTLDKNDQYRKILEFILEKFSSALKQGSNWAEEPWKKFFENVLPVSELNTGISTELKRETIEVEKVGLTDDKLLIMNLVKLIETMCISEEEEIKLSKFLITKGRERCCIHREILTLYCYTDDQEICVECLVCGHVKHHIEPIGTALHNRYSPFWEKLNVELEDVKHSARNRITELDILTETIAAEKLRDFEILERCAEIKPKMDELSAIFASGKLESNDNNVLAMLQFLEALGNESKRWIADYEKMEGISAHLSSLMHQRCSSCASISDAASQIVKLEHSEEIDVEEPLSTANCIRILSRLENGDNQLAYNRAFDFVMMNFTDVVKQCGVRFYRGIGQSVLEDLLKTDKLNVESEDDVLNVVINWVELDFRQRKTFTVQLLKYVRFGCVSECLLREIEADANHIIMMNDVPRNLLLNALASDGNCYPRDWTVSKILAFGDDRLNMCFNSFTQTWEEWRGEDKGRGFGAVNVGENIFIIGGIDNGTTLSRVSLYNRRKNIWKKGPSLQQGRYFFGSCVNSSNTIYAVGGCNAGRSVEMLNCNLDGEPVGEWQILPSMKTARSHLEAVVVDDKVYAIGGSSNMTTMEVFDHGVKGWRSCKSMSQAKDSISSATHNGEIYVFGQSGVCEKYNPVTNKWATIAVLEGNSPFRGSAVLNDKIYLISGNSNSAEMNVYDIKTNKWFNGPSMPKKIGYTKCVACKYNH